MATDSVSSPISRKIPMTSELIHYDAMCRAIDAAYEVDEVKDVRDKALAIEMYAKQAHNVEAERRACEIRLRAERKAGELLKAMKESGERRSGHGDQKSESRPTTPKLKELGITRDQSSKWQKLADVPKDDFEAALRGEDKPTTNGLIAAPDRQTDPDATWVWERLQDFERNGILSRDPAKVLAVMPAHMHATVLRLAPLVIEWLTSLMRDEVTTVMRTTLKKINGKVPIGQQATFRNVASGSCVWARHNGRWLSATIMFDPRKANVQVQFDDPTEGFYNRKAVITYNNLALRNPYLEGADKPA
jgi:hypothetical protein